MKLEQAHIDKIKTAFEKIQSKEDLLQVLNGAKPFVYGEKAVPFELKQLTWFANPNLGKKRYTEFKIKKKSGKERSIHAPVNGLKALQKTLSFVLQCVFEPHNAATGFVKDKSIVDNAKLHVGSKYVYNIDLKDFFPSIDQARVWKCFQLKPFNLNKETSEEHIYIKWEEFRREYLKNEKLEIVADSKNGFYFKTTAVGNFYLSDEVDIEKDCYVAVSKDFIKTLGAKPLTEKFTIVNEIPNKSKLDIANILASLCCTEMEVERKTSLGEWEKVKRNVLPQGAPTSPVITNIICQRLDHILSGVAKRFGLKYSRYADDITFSSMHNLYQAESEFLNELHRIIAEQGFHIKESKTRLQKDGYRKEVTGLLVNEKLNVQLRYIKQLRMWLYYWEQYGYVRASSFFTKQYVAEKGHVKNSNPSMLNVIGGKLDYLKMVKGEDNEMYLNLRGRFNSLNGRSIKSEKNIIDSVLDSTLDMSKTDLQKELHIGQSQKGFNKEILKPKIIKTDKSILPIIHNPKELVGLLKKFSLNDTALKYTTHSWDAGRDVGIYKNLDDFLIKAKNEYSKFSFNLKGLSENLNGKIYNFLFNPNISENGWGIKRIKFGWSSKELQTACNNNFELKPEDFVIPESFQVQVSGRLIQKFKHVIDLFKNEIEIRDENSALINLILQKHDSYLTSFSNPILTNLENKSFYSDIQSLSSALDLIFESIQKYPQHPVVEYYVKDMGNDSIILNILQKESFKTGLSIYDEKLNLTRGDLGTLKDKLQNLCDWSIESKFKEGYYRINYLASDKLIPFLQKIESTEGFKHILTFYK